MKNSKAIVSILSILVHSIGAEAQVRVAFDQLELASVTSQFFFPQTFQDWKIPAPDSYETAFNGFQAAKIFYNFDNACIDPGYAIGDFGSLRQALVNQNAFDGSIPISILDITYHDFVSEALSANLIYFENGKFYDTPAWIEDPFRLKAFKFALEPASIMTRNHPTCKQLLLSA